MQINYSGQINVEVKTWSSEIFKKIYSALYVQIKKINLRHRVHLKIKVSDDEVFTSKLIRPD